MQCIIHKSNTGVELLFYNPFYFLLSLYKKRAGEFAGIPSLKGAIYFLLSFYRQYIRYSQWRGVEGEKTLAFCGAFSPINPMAGLIFYSRNSPIVSPLHKCYYISK
jgi:hypothetical protein